MFQNLQKLFQWKISKISLFIVLFGNQFVFSQNFQDGNWYKLEIQEEGFYKITGEILLSYGIDLNQFKANEIALYGLDYELPESLGEKSFKNKPKAIPLIPDGDIPVNWSKQTSFYFYAKGANSTIFCPEDSTWKFKKHHYSKKNYYFIHLKDSNPHFITQKSNFPTANILSETYGLDNLVFEDSNPLKSGRKWLGKALSNSENIQIVYELPNYISKSPIQIRGTLANGSIYPSKFVFKNGTNINSIETANINPGRYSKKYISKDFNYEIIPELSNKEFKLSIEVSNQAGQAYINEIELNYLKNIVQNKNWDISYSNSSKITTFPIKITEDFICIEEQTNGEFFKLVESSGVNPYSKIIIGKKNQVKIPTTIQKANFINPKDYQKSMLLLLGSYNLLEGLKAYQNYRSKKLPTSIAFLEDIYNTYSGGKIDPTAIRNFLFDVKINQGSTFEYLLLAGDASWDYKNIYELENDDIQETYIPTYETLESSEPLLSYGSDDFFGFLSKPIIESVEVSQDLSLDLGIGRIPCATNEELTTYLNKIKAYEKQIENNLKIPVFNLIADNGDQGIHLFDAENFAKKLNQNSPFIIHKTYLDNFPLEKQNDIEISPEASKAVIDAINRTAKFIHFMGHGSQNGWTDEKILTNNDIIGLTNHSNLPILFTATCDFSNYDNPFEKSGGELGILSKFGGWPAIISTSRPVFQNNNYLFGLKFYDAILENLHNQEFYLGDLLKLTKNKTKNLGSNRNIILLGDPTLSLPWIYDDELSGLQIDQDQISVLDNQNNTLFGEILISQEDKISLNSKLNYQDNSPIMYQLRGQKNTTTIDIKIPRYSIKEEINPSIYLTKKGQDSKKYFAKINLPNKSPQDILADPLDFSFEYLENRPQSLDSILIKVQNPHEFKLSNNSKKSKVVLNDSLAYPLADYILIQPSNSKESWYRIPIENPLIEIFGVLNAWNSQDEPINIEFNFKKSAEINENKFILYPNPINAQNENLSILLNEPLSFQENSVQLEIFNYSGKLLKKINSLSLENNTIKIPLNNFKNEKILMVKIEYISQKLHKYIYFTEKIFLK